MSTCLGKALNVAGFDVGRDHEQSYHSFMHKHLFAHIDIDPKDVHILDGNAENLEEECAKYEEEIRKVGGIELFLGGKQSQFHNPLLTVFRYRTRWSHRIQ